MDKQIPVIMLSSMGQEEVVLNAFDLGAADFIVKPFSPNELILRIKRFSK
jgi:DNA-binding response OmpR family regulator